MQTVSGKNDYRAAVYAQDDGRSLSLAADQRTGALFLWKPFLYYKCPEMIPT